MSTESEHQVLCERYELERVLREDALGRTWRAVNLKSTAKVDVRMIPDWADRTEARALFEAVKTLQNPGLIGTLDLVVDGDLAGYVLDASDGETMQQRRARRPRRHFEISEIKPWLRSIVDALGCLHEQGHAHGALHTGSFLVEGTDLKITDLAVAPLLLPQAKLDGRAALPAAVMSPEVLGSHKPGVADDIYALGAMIYDLLTGQPLFSSGDIPTQVMGLVPPGIQERRAQLDIPSGPLPQPWEDWIVAALSKEAKQRPSLEDLSVLLRSGQFGGRTSQDTGTRSTQASASSSTWPGAATPARAKIPRNRLILGGAILVLVALIAGVYLLKVKPRQEFNAALGTAYQTAQNFDDTNPAQHDEVIQRWQKFESEWQTRVQTERPESQSTLAMAKQKRQARELLKTKVEERARQENERKRKAYAARARAAFDIAKVKAGAAGAQGNEALAVWTEFVTKFDTGYEGARLDEIAPMLAEAKAAQRSIEKAIADEQKERENFIAQRMAELTALDQAQLDAGTPAAEKLKRVEAFIAACATAPASAMGDPSFAAIKSKAETKLEFLRSAALAETSESPLDPDALFADPTVKAMSKTERQRLLKKVQEELKTAGHFAGDASGTADKATRDAITDYQKANDLALTGTLDEATLTAMQLGESADGASPMPGAVASKPGGGSRSRSKPKEENKGVLQKTKDGIKKVGSSIGNFFTGGKKN